MGYSLKESLMSIVCCRVTPYEISIASDSIVVRGYTQGKDKNKFAKLFKVNDLIIGSVGYAEESSLFRIYCSTRQPASISENDILIFISEFAQWKKERTTIYSIENSYIIIFNNKAFHIEGFFVNEILDYEAIGAGMDFALATLYLGHDVEKAVETACELSVFCEKPIIKYTITQGE
jgi:ATP-dependent protease HslVU (ClpYQ) peptidase subunit